MCFLAYCHSVLCLFVVVSQFQKKATEKRGLFWFWMEFKTPMNPYDFFQSRYKESGSRWLTIVFGLKVHWLFNSRVMTMDDRRSKQSNKSGKSQSAARTHFVNRFSFFFRLLFHHHHHHHDCRRCSLHRRRYGSFSLWWNYKEYAFKRTQSEGSNDWTRKGPWAWK